MIPKIYGFNKTSEAGLKVFSPSIFIQGCNLQCPFCFNSLLAKSKMKKEDEVPLSVVDEFIEKEKPDMIMISGGEPLMLKNIGELMDHFIDQGLQIGLSTHGLFPERLSKILPKVNYVALDIKTDRQDVYKYLDLSHSDEAFDAVLVSKELLDAAQWQREDFDFEARTTLYPPYVNKDTIDNLGNLMQPNVRWILQQYRPTKNLYDMDATKGVMPYDRKTLEEMLAIARTFTTEAHLRYV